ncbi:MAG: DNA-directed RNA polymerase subunit omega [Deltaproteobacteria bacterium]|nr:DNA-directed RNA polymerase subunit omega [Deltaproteobacteria bacterium]
MARITVEDCLENCENRFALVHIAAKRARELYKGVEPLYPCKNKEIVTALREIAASLIGFSETREEEEKKPSKK